MTPVSKKVLAGGTIFPTFILGLPPTDQDSGLPLSILHLNVGPSKSLNMTTMAHIMELEMMDDPVTSPAHVVQTFEPRIEHADPTGLP